MSLVFYIVYSALQWLSSVTGLSYEMVNVLIWYGLIPAGFLFLIDRIIRRPIFLPVFVAAIAAFGVCVRDMESAAGRIFNGSIDFLLGFSRFGIGYDLASVIICVWIPVFVFLALAILAYPQWFERHAPALTSRLRCVPRKSGQASAPNRSAAPHLNSDPSGHESES